MNFFDFQIFWMTFSLILAIRCHILVTFAIFLGTFMSHFHYFWSHLCHIFTIYGHIFVTFSLFLLKVMSHFHYFWSHLCHIYVTFSLFLTTVMSHFNYFGHISIWGKCATSHWHLTGGPLERFIQKLWICCRPHPKGIYASISQLPMVQTFLNLSYS